MADELHQGRWRKSHYRPDIYGEANLPESFTEQQARFAKTRIEVGLVRGDFQCLQGMYTGITETRRSRMLLQLKLS